MVNFYTTRDQGSVHIAASQNNQPALYQGSINSYNNCLTRFIFKTVLNKAMDVNFNGKVFCVEKADYSRFYSRLGKNVTLNEINQHQEFNTDGLNLVQNLGLMRDKLSVEKIERLSQKLILAIQTNQIDRAKYLLAKGADVNKQYWIRGNHEIIYSGHFTNELPYKNIDTFAAKHLTPLLHSIEKNMGQPFVNLLHSYGANPQILGKSLLFNRTIVDVTNPITIDPVLTYVPGRPRYHAHHHRHHHHAPKFHQPTLRAGVNIHQETHLRLQDRTFNVYDLQVNAQLNGLNNFHRPDEEKTVEYTRVLNRHNTTMVF